MNDGQLLIQNQQIEFLNSQSIPTLGITFGLFNENDFTNWRVTMMAPKDTSYKGGLFYLSVHFPEFYPNVPPVICFITPIYHMNVNPFVPRNPGADPLGFIPIQSLGFWNSNYSIKEIFLSIYSLFYYVNLEYSYGFSRIEEYKNNRAVYEEKIKHYTKLYANPSTNSNDFNRNRDRNWFDNF